MPIDIEDLPYDPTTLHRSPPLAEVTQSSVAAFQRCQTKWFYRYRMHLVPVNKSIHLVIGRAVHAAFEEIFSTTPRKPKDPTISQIARKRIDAVFESEVDGNESWTADHEALEYGRAQATAVVEAWIIINGGWTESLKVVAPEMNIRAVAKATAEEDPLWARTAGKIDGVVIDDSGNTWLLEHKTRWSIRDTDFLQALPVDHQTLFYAVLYRHVLKRIEKDRTVGLTVHGKQLAKVSAPVGFYYDVMVKPKHRKGDTFEELKDRMVQAILEYPETYLCFEPVVLESAAVDRAEKNLERIVAEMDAIDADNVTQNFSACADFAEGCPYRSLCISGANAANPSSVFESPAIDHYIIQAPFEELDAAPAPAKTKKGK